MREKTDPMLLKTRQIVSILKKAGVSYFRSGDLVIRFSVDRKDETCSAHQVTSEAQEIDREQPTPDVDSEKIDFEFSHT